MKKAYSEFRHLNKQALKALEKIPEQDQLANLYREMRRLGASADDVIEEYSTMKMSIRLQESAKSGNCVHYFFSGHNFYDWLGSCKTPMHEDEKGIFDDMNTECSTPFMLHFQGGSSPAYLCSWVDSHSPLTGHPWAGRTLFVSMGAGFHSYRFYPRGTDEGSNEDCDTALVRAVVFSAMAYVQAFPEMVVDGIPEDLRHGPRYRGRKCMRVGMSPSLILRDGPSPHYRMGHFRYLQSDRFKKMRGKTIFVHGTFVKGKAKTVLSPEDSVIA